MDKELDRFDLEDSIIQLYNIIDDLETFMESQKVLSADEKNAVLGMMEMHKMRYTKAWNNMSELIKLDKLK